MGRAGYCFGLGLAAAAITSAGAQCYTYEPSLRTAGQPQGTQMVVFDPDGPQGPRSDMLVVAGTLPLDTSLPASGLAVYDGENWRDISAPLDGPVSQLEVWQNLLVISGPFTSVEGQPCNGLATWDGDNWRGLGADLTRDGTAGPPLRFVVRDSELFVTGNITHARGVPMGFITRFDGQQWRDVGGGIDSATAEMLNWDGRVYITDPANLRRAGELAVRGAALWTGSAWEQTVTAPVNAGIAGAAGAFLHAVSQSYLGGGTYNTELLSNDGSGWTVVDRGRRWDDGGSWASSRWVIRNGSVYRVDDATDAGLFEGFFSTVTPIRDGETAPSFRASGSGVDDWVRFRDRWHVSGQMNSINLEFATAVSRLESGGVEPVWPAMTNPTVTCAASSVGRFVVQYSLYPTLSYRSQLFRHVEGRWVRDLVLDSGAGYMTLGLSERSAFVQVFSDGTYSYRALRGDQWVPMPALDGWAVYWAGSWRGDVIGLGTQWPGGSSNRLGVVTTAGFAPLPPGGPSIRCEVLDVRGTLVAIESVPGYERISAFDGREWTNLGTDKVVVAAVHEGNLFILANRRSAPNARTRYDLRWWDGAQWHDVAGGVVLAAGAPVNLLSFDRSLFLIGDFTELNGIPIRFVARFDGERWSEIGGGTDRSVQAAAADEDGLLLFGEALSTGGGVATGNYASLRRATTCPSDLSCDGGVDGSDVEAFFRLWERAAPAADLNGDGGVDGADVGAFFAAWEAGC